MTSDPPEPAAALYRLPPEAFIAARDRLTRDLRDKGRAEEAAEVKALRKPSIPAWALNQLADRDLGCVGELLDAGAELRAAQQATMSSARNAGRLRAASEERRLAVMRLTGVASEILSAAGRTSSAHLDEVTAGLEAASVDPDAGDRLRSGTFARPPAPPVGFGEISGLTIVPADPEASRSTPQRGRATRTAEASKGRRADDDAVLTAEVARLRRDRDASARRLRKDRGSAELLARERAELQARLLKVQDKEARAESRAKAAEIEAKAAERALKRTKEQLARARPSTDGS